MGGRGQIVRVGIVGCGSFGRNTYARHVAGHDEAVVAAACDVDQERVAELIEEFGDDSTGAYSDYEEMIRREELDLVAVGTMADIRPQVSTLALANGAHVLAAKPMAPTLTQARDMVRAAEEAGRLMMVGYNFRFREDAQALRRFIDEGGLGDPLYARAWIHAEGVPVWGPHYIKAQSAGGALASTGVHLLDLAAWYLGGGEVETVEAQVHSRMAALPGLPSELEAVRGQYDCDDLVSAYVRFADGRALTSESVWMAPPLASNNGVDVWGTSGFGRLGPLQLLSWQDGEYVDRTEEVAPGLAARFEDVPGERTRREMFHFIDCVLGRAEPLITPQEMLTNQAIVDAIYGLGE